MTRREREITDMSQILELLHRCKYLHLGLVDGDQPYVVPLNYGFTYENDRLTLYMHGARKGYKYEVIERNPKVSFAMECDLQPISGGDVACKYGQAYASVMGKGVASIVTDPAEKCRALTILMQTQVDRDFAFTDKLAAVVNVIRVDVSEFSAKSRPIPEANPQA